MCAQYSLPRPVAGNIYLSELVAHVMTVRPDDLAGRILS